MASRKRSKLSVIGKSIINTVNVSTDLPPNVDGQTRCYLTLKVKELRIFQRKKMGGMEIRVRWWGESGEGTGAVFKASLLPAIAKYPIKCGPKQFNAYLKDMEYLHFDVVDGTGDGRGRREGEAVAYIKNLTKSNSMNDILNIVPINSDKIIGKLKVEINIVPVPKGRDQLAPPHVTPRSPIIEERSSTPLPQEESHTRRARDTPISDLISMVIQRSRQLKRDIVDSQMKDLSRIDNFDAAKKEIESSIEQVPKRCINEVSREDLRQKEKLPESDNIMDLIFGKNHINDVVKKHGLDISISSSSSVSSLNDESLIEHLFYKKQHHDQSVVSDDSFLEGPSHAVQRPLDNSKDGYDTTGDRNLQCSAPTQPHDKATRDDKPVACLHHEELSLNQIAELGRVNKCKIQMEKIELDDPVISGTFFVEYKIPLLKYPETITVTGRATVDRAITLDHVNIVPIMFDESLINQWTMESIQFRLFYKPTLQEPHRIIGDGALSLRNVITAKNFKLEHTVVLRSVNTGDAMGFMRCQVHLLGGLHGTNVREYMTKDIGAHGVPLQMVVMVTCGKAIQGLSKSSVNSYLTLRIVDVAEKFSSDVIWDNHHPDYNFKSVIPLTYTTAYRDRLKDNYVIMETWNKPNAGGSDELLGLTKLPTNQFYLSLREGHIADLIEGTGPVVAVDGYMPVMNIVTNERTGMLKCFLALGTAQQCSRALAERNSTVTVTASRDSTTTWLPSNISGGEGTRERVTLHRGDGKPYGERKIRHMIQVSVEIMDQVDMLEGSTFGETDCYISYSLPSSRAVSSSEVEVKRIVSRTCTAGPAMRFDTCNTTCFVLPECSTSPIQFLARYLENGAVRFEFWRRFYYPNVRDQLYGRCSILLHQLSHLMSLNPSGEQVFSLPVERIHSPDDEEANKMGLILGRLKVGVAYQSEVVSDLFPESSPNYVQLTVDVNRACGLKYAAEYALGEGAPIEYAASTGVDSYVQIELSFAGIERVSGLRARSFTPNYSSHFSLSLPTVFLKTSCEIPTLAENLMRGHLIVNVYHKLGAEERKSDDVLLCRTRLPLEKLIRSQTGEHGWYPMFSPLDETKYLAAIELEVSFGEVSERETAVQDACTRGWVPPPLPYLDSPFVSLSLEVDRIWITGKVMERYQTNLETILEERECYVRVKFYNSEAICSDPILFTTTNVTKDNCCHGNMSHEQGNTFRATFNFSATTNLLWCLREEPLELQVWLLPRSGATVGDTLLGCGYLSLAHLLTSPSFPASHSTVSYLVKPTSASMGGAGCHINVSLDKLQSKPQPPALPPPVSQKSSSPVPELLDKEAEADLITEPDPIPGIACRVVIEKVVNVRCDLSSTPSPSLFCTIHCSTCPLASTPAYTLSNSVRMDHTVDITIPYEVFSAKDKSIKVVVKARETATSSSAGQDVDDGGDGEVIGTASVDLAPLLIGFRNVEGWYFLEDIYSKDSFGEVFVAVHPLEPLTHDIIREKMSSVSRRPSEASSGPQLSSNFLKKPTQKKDDGERGDIGAVFQSLSDVEGMIQRIRASLSTEDKSDEQRPGSCYSLNQKSEPTVFEKIVEESELVDIHDDLKEDSSQMSEVQRKAVYVDPEDGKVHLNTDGSQGSGDVSRLSDVPDKECDQITQLSDTKWVQMSQSLIADFLPDDDTTGELDDIIKSFESEEFDLSESSDNVTMETGLLADTVSSITDLLEGVRQQSSNIEKLFSSDWIPTIDGSTPLPPAHTSGEEGDLPEVPSPREFSPLRATSPELQYEARGDAQVESSLSVEEKDVFTSQPNDEHHNSHQLTGTSLPSDGEVIEEQRESTGRSGDMQGSLPKSFPSSYSADDGKISGISEGEGEPLFSDSYNIPDFFSSAKQLSSTLSLLRNKAGTTVSSSSTSSLTAGQHRLPTPDLPRRVPLQELMRKIPVQRDRIEKIFKQDQSESPE